MPIAFLLAMQASGMVVDWLGKNEQVRLGKMGNQVEQAGITANIATSRVESEDASLNAMKQLRQNLGTQAAIYAARGIRSGTPTTALTTNESVGNFNADERIRRINQTGREAAYKAQQVLSNLHQTTSENNIWNQFRNNAISKIPTSTDSWKRIGEGFSAKNNYGFGITSV
jgi:hypothetical protein